MEDFYKNSRFLKFMVQIQNFLNCNIIVVFLTTALYHSHLTITNIVYIEVHKKTWNWKKKKSQPDKCTKKILNIKTYELWARDITYVKQPLTDLPPPGWKEAEGALTMHAWLSLYSIVSTSCRLMEAPSLSCLRVIFKDVGDILLMVWRRH